MACSPQPGCVDQVPLVERLSRTRKEPSGCRSSRQWTRLTLSSLMQMVQAPTSDGSFVPVDFEFFPQIFLPYTSTWQDGLAGSGAFKFVGQYEHSCLFRVGDNS
jgi:hypothetical protein